MTIFEFFEYAAWVLSALLGLWMLIDMIRTDRSYTEELLISSKEGEIEDAPTSVAPEQRERR